MGNQKDGEWPENRAFSLLAPLAGDTELMERTKPEAKAQLVASQPRHGHHHITMNPGRHGGNPEPGVAGSRLTCQLFLVGSVTLSRSIFLTAGSSSAK